MTAFKGLGTYGNGVGVVTPLDHKLAQAGLLVKTSTPLGVRSGVFFQGNASLVTGTAAMAYSVAAYACATQRSPGAGVVLGGNDGAVSVATTAAPGSNSRIDIIYHFHREFALGDADSNPVIGVVQGTAAASPVAPSLAAFPGAIELARVTVAAGATSTNGAGVTITNSAPFTSVDGGRVPFRNSTEMNAWSSALPEQTALDLSTLTTYKRAGAVWAPVSAVCVLQKTTDQSLTTTLTALTWDVEIADDSGMHSNSVNNSRIIAPSDGVYEFTASVYNNNTSGMGVLQGRANGSANIVGAFTRREAAGSLAGALPMSITFPLLMTAGQYVEIMVSHSAAGGAIASAGPGGASLTAKRIG